MRHFSDPVNKSVVMLYLLAVFPFSMRAAQGQGRQADPDVRAAVVQGTVRDENSQAVAGATISLRTEDGQSISRLSDSKGAYRFSEIGAGSYTLRAEKAEQQSSLVKCDKLGSRESRTIDLTLESAKIKPQNSAARPEFFDEPHFTVAGVTDTTNLGGHGSDTIVRNREALAKDTASLGKESSEPPANASSGAVEQSFREAADNHPEDFGANYRLGKMLVGEGNTQEALEYLERASKLNPRDLDNAYELALGYANAGNYAKARANAQTILAEEPNPVRESQLHHLLGDVDEKLSDALDAVREYQRAVELNPSETNIFDWGAELLLHHAPEPALEVFTKGNRLFPRSSRMLSGLGAALYSLGSTNLAAQRFCEASDLDPNNPAPYLLMGKMQAAESMSSEAIVERLARFAKLQPENAWANYYYALSLWQQERSQNDSHDIKKVRTLLETAVHLDPTLALGYLQLGIIDSEQKDMADAIRAYEHAIQASPGLEQAHYRLAQAYRQTGEIVKAQAEMKLYRQIATEEAQEVERRRHEVQQFVYEMRESDLKR